MDVTSIALSGLNAAERRLENSANNIANAETTGFTPKDVVQSALTNGGVTTEPVERKPDTISIQNADGQEEKLPNVSVDEELMNAQSATYDYQANLQVLKRQKEMDKSLLDIQA